MNGCHNRAPFLPELEVPDGWNDDGTRRVKVIPFVMATDCQHDSREDERCGGCRWQLTRETE